MFTVSQADVEAAELSPPAVRALAELQAAHDDPAVSVAEYTALGRRWEPIVQAPPGPLGGGHHGGLLGVVAWRYRREA